MAGSKASPSSTLFRRALDQVTLEIPSSGYTLGLVGESGSGKTTLGMSIMNLIEPPGRITNGTVEYQGKNVLTMRESELNSYRWKEVSMVFQSAMNSLNPVKKASDHIVEVLRAHERIPKKEAKERATKLLVDVGIPADRTEAYPHEFSGGMRQRVVIAMALALSPKLLIADEPTSALDVVVQRAILKLLKKKVSGSGLSFLFITHELAILRGLVDNVAVLYAGRLVELGPAEKVLYDPLHPYTRMLVSSVLSMKSERSKLKEKSAFSEQRKEISDKLRSSDYVLKEVEKGRWVAF